MTRRPPCHRAACSNRVKRPDRLFCSSRCAYLHRVETDTWHGAPGLTPEARLRGAQRGGLVSGARRRQAAVRRAVAEIESLIPAPLVDTLPPPARRLVRVMLARAFRRGVRYGRDDRLRARLRLSSTNTTCSQQGVS